MKKTDLAYFAGILDGEGSITIGVDKTISKTGKTRITYRLRVDVGNTNEWLIQQLKFAFGGCVVLRREQTVKTQTIWAWRVSCLDALRFLQAIYPYVKIKKPQVDLAIKFQEARAHRIRNKPLSDGEAAIQEAQKIMLSDLNCPAKKIQKDKDE